MLFRSTTNAPGADEFRWSVVNRAGEPLCELVFDNYTFHISRILSDGLPAVDTLMTYQTNTPHTLTLRLDFGANQWSAALSNHVSRAQQVLVTNMPLSAAGAALDLGDVDVSWVVSDFLNPGDNFIEFDGVSVVAKGPGEFAVASLQPNPGGRPVVRVLGEEGARFRVEAAGMVDAPDAL